MRRTGALLGLALMLAGGCDAERVDPSIPDGPSGCPLLSTVEVSDTTGLTAPQPRAELHLPASTRACRYEADNGSIAFFVAAESRTGTAEQVADREIQQYGGDLEPITGLGDAARYKADQQHQYLVVTRLDGTEMRIVTLVGTLPTPADPQALVGLARTLLSRV